jgi:hypothetical protein
MHEAAALLFRGYDQWITAPEVTFSVYGERGAIDLLAFHPARRALLVVELKTQLVDVQGLIGSMDRYLRLAGSAAKPHGWRASHVSGLVLLRETTTNRRAVAAHRHVLKAAFPHDTGAIRQWLEDPAGNLRGLRFLSDSHVRTDSARQTGVRRVRKHGASVETGANRR